MSINYIIIRQTSDFETIISSPIFISGSQSSLDKETAQNMWALSLDHSRTISLGNLITFINALIARKQQQAAHICTLYMWFDEMSNQLRFNVISGRDQQLPFGCTIEQTASPEPILRKFLESTNTETISWDEMESLDSGNNNEQTLYALEVFAQHITPHTQ